MTTTVAERESATLALGGATVTNVSGGVVFPTGSDTPRTLADWMATLNGKREVLTAWRQYWVNPNEGSDSNDGLSGANAFATLQKAIDVIWETLDTAGYGVQIQLFAASNETYGVATGPVPGGGTVTINGNSSDPASIVLTRTGGNLITAQYGAALTVTGIEMRTVTSGNCLQAQFGGNIYYTNVAFGSCAGAHVEAKGGGQTLAGSAYTISGGAVSHFHAAYDATIVVSGSTITLTGTPAFSAYFAGVGENGNIQAISTTFSGSATGTRAYLHYGGAIRTNTNLRTKMPGSLPVVVNKGSAFDSIQRMTEAVTGTASLVIDDNGKIFLCDAASGSFSINLPAASTADGVEYTFKKTTASNTVTLDANSSETIDGATTLAMTTQWTSVTLHCDGSAWYSV